MAKQKSNQAFQIRIKIIPKAPVKPFYLKGICVALTEGLAKQKVIESIKEWLSLDEKIKDSETSIMEIKKIRTDFLMQASNDKN